MTQDEFEAVHASVLARVRKEIPLAGSIDFMAMREDKDTTASIVIDVTFHLAAKMPLPAEMADVANATVEDFQKAVDEALPWMIRQIKEKEPSY